MKQFVWGALPYIAFTFLIVGTIVRYTVFERNWTTKSSQFLTKGNLPLAGPMFHLGLVMALGGHIIGVLIPKAATEARGRSLREAMARGTAVATWKRSWKTGVTAAMRPKVTARPESAPAVATSTGVRGRALRAWLLMCLVSQAPPASASAAGCRP